VEVLRVVENRSRDKETLFREADRDSRPVTNTPDLVIDPDDDNDDLELYDAPVQPPVKP
jgi:hypothetical protein